MARSTVTPTPTTTPQRRLRSLKFVAEYLGVDERSVRRFIARGDLKAYRLGRGTSRAVVRLDLNDVEAFVTPVEPHSVSA